MNEDSVDRANEEYDQAEQAYLSALASGAEDADLHPLAQQVAEAAKAWESIDAVVPPPSGIARYYEAPEILSTLWSDLAGAYDRRIN